VSGAAAARAGAFFAAPFRDLLRGLDRLLQDGAAAFGWIALGLVAGWWLYVPLHELLHAAGCVLAGGTVSRLEIDPLYGGGLLARIFPFVHSGSDYAGRLSGFDTRGSDLVYLATDLAPFLLTLFPGVWALRRAARRGKPLLWGASLPFALAPFLSITGDAYEIGSLAAVHLPPARGLRQLVGDDVLRKAAEIDFGDPALAAGFALAILVGAAWCFAWWALGAWIAKRAGEPVLEPPSR
jgi:hypothetical protein